MVAEERKPLFTSEVVNTLAPMKVDTEQVYQTPVKKGRIKWAGSPMRVDGAGDYDVPKGGKGLRKSISALFGSPMKVDGPGVVGGDSLRKPLPGLCFVEIPARNRARRKRTAAS